jgi:sulfopyruvate decarboxylase TPP-binding subunit
MSLEAKLRSSTSASQVEALRGAGIDFFTGVPDSEFQVLVEQLESSASSEEYAPATREDGAVAMGCGAALAGRQPLVFMESAGFGTSLDSITSLAIAYGVPLVLLIAWAGYKGRDTPHHNPLGRPLAKIFDSLDLPAFVVCEPNESNARLAKAVEAAVSAARTAEGPAAVLGVPAALAEADRELR